MRLDLTELLLNVGKRLPYEVSEPPIVDEDLECTAPIEGRMVFTNTGSVLLMEGSVETRVALPCSRCAVYFEEPVWADLSDQFALEAKAAGPHGRASHVEVEEDVNPSAGRLFEGHLFDLTEFLRQNILLSLPSSPLHDASCRGLCAACGKDLNEGPCGCPAVPAAPALSGLAVLLGSDNEG